MHRFIVLALIGLALIGLLAGCGSSETTTPIPATAEPQAQATATPAPTIAVAAIKMEDIDFDALLVADGDLPTGYATGQFGAVEVRKDLATPDAKASTTFEVVGQIKGSVSLVAYDDAEQAAKAYPVMAPAFGDGKPLDGVGEQAMYYDGVGYPGRDRPSEVTFVRCNVIVNAVMFYNDFNPAISERTAIIYAERLDKRIKKTVCP